MIVLLQLVDRQATLIISSKMMPSVQVEWKLGAPRDLCHLIMNRSHLPGRLVTRRGGKSGNRAGGCEGVCNPGLKPSPHESETEPKVAGDFLNRPDISLEVDSGPTAVTKLSAATLVSGHKLDT